jgi:hypothetical protein
MDSLGDREPGRKPARGPYFKEEIKASNFPAFDGTSHTFDLWLEKGDKYYSYGYETQLAEVLAQHGENHISY